MRYQYTPREHVLSRRASLTMAARAALEAAGIPGKPTVVAPDPEVLQFPVTLPAAAASQLEAITARLELSARMSAPALVVKVEEEVTDDE